MPFCASCGSPVDGKFCPKCGAAVGNAGPPSGNPAPSVAPPQAASRMGSNVAGALCYVLGLITGILFLVLEPYNRDREVRFHAFQSILFNLALVAIYIVLGILGSVMGAVVPVAGAALIGLVSLVLWLGSLVLWIVLIVKTYGGARIVLPVIGEIAAKQA